MRKLIQYTFESAMIISQGSHFSRYSISCFRHLGDEIQLVEGYGILNDYTDYYTLLSLPEHPGPEEIKAAWRKAVLIHHPDVNNNSPASQTAFLLISAAYAVLNDPEKKKEYDAFLSRHEPSPRRKKTPESNKHKFKNQFNHILWDIEDLLLETHKRGQADMLTEMNIQKNILRMLTFLEKWVLESAGLKDYFMEARKLQKIDPSVYIDAICMGKSRLAHFPFTTVENYFYDIRKRMNKFLDLINHLDLLAVIGGTNVRIIDALIEAQNYSFFYLSHVREKNPRFSHSNPCFQWL